MVDAPRADYFFQNKSWGGAVSWLAGGATRMFLHRASFQEEGVLLRLNWCEPLMFGRRYQFAAGGDRQSILAEGERTAPASPQAAAGGCSCRPHKSGRRSSTTATAPGGISGRFLQHRGPDAQDHPSGLSQRAATTSTSCCAT